MAVFVVLVRRKISNFSVLYIGLPFPDLQVHKDVGTDHHAGRIHRHISVRKAFDESCQLIHRQPAGEKAEAGSEISGPGRTGRFLTDSISILDNISRIGDFISLNCLPPSLRTGVIHK